MVLIYALFGMICWGLAPIFGKLGLNGVNPVTAIVLRTFIAATFVTGWVVSTRAYYDFYNIPLAFWLFIAIEAILATLLGDLAYFAALKYGDVNVVTLVMSCAPLVTILANYFILGEAATVRQLAGAVLITGGLLLVCLE